MAAKNIDFGWYQYTDSKGRTWAMKVSKTIGDDPAFGFGALDRADPVFVRRARQRPRYAQWIDPNTGRTTTTPIGSLTATMWTDGNPTYTGYARDTVTDIVYQLAHRYDEKIPEGGTIKSKDQPA